MLHKFLDFVFLFVCVEFILFLVVYPFYCERGVECRLLQNACPLQDAGWFPEDSYILAPYDLVF